MAGEQIVLPQQGNAQVILTDIYKELIVKVQDVAEDMKILPKIQYKFWNMYPRQKWYNTKITQEAD